MNSAWLDEELRYSKIIRVNLKMDMVMEPQEADGGVAVQEGRPKLKDPPQFAVILHNDDYTTMEFVTEILRRYFHRTEEEAVQIMLQVHKNGKGVAGIYHHEIAETKVAQVHQYARSKGFPLKCTVEPAA
jgi:ATP-dependent Clp protease adaptor protein ClpS